MKPNRLYAFQGKQLKNSLQQFWDRNRILGLFSILTILLIIPIATKTVDLTSWIFPEKSAKPDNNFIENPAQDHVKVLTNKPVRAIKILHTKNNKNLVLTFDRFLENATVQVYDLNGKRVFISESQDG